MSSSDEVSPARTAPSPELIPMLSDPEISINDSNQMKGVENYSLEQMNYLLQLCSQCERHEDVLEVFERLYSEYPHTPLSKANRSILEGSLKSQVSTKQKQLVKLNSLLEYSEKNKTDEVKKEQKHLYLAIDKEKERLVEETSEYINRVMKLIDSYCLKNISIGNKTAERKAEAFLLRIKGDNYKYLSQLETIEDEKHNLLQLSKESFNKAYQISSELQITSNLEHLKLVYSYSNFLSSYCNEPKEAEEILNNCISNEEINSILQEGEGVSSEAIGIVKTIFNCYNDLKSKNDH